jgi:hypothetical protein
MAGIGTMHKIQYKLPTFTRVGSGGTIEDYSPGEIDYAIVTNLNSRLDAVGLQQVDSKFMRFDVRQRDSLTLNQNIVINYRGLDYKVLTIDPIEGRRYWLRITAEAFK